MLKILLQISEPDLRIEGTAVSAPIFVFTKPRYPGFHVVNLKIISEDGVFMNMTLGEEQVEEIQVGLDYHLQRHKERNDGEGA